MRLDDASSRSPEFLPLAPRRETDRRRRADRTRRSRCCCGSSTLLATSSHGFRDSAEHLGDRVSRSGAGRPSRRRRREQVRLVRSPRHLAADLEVHRRLRIVGQSAGVDEPERAAVPLGHREMAVARRPRLLGDDGAVVPDDAIEQRGLSDVRPPDECDDWNAHAGAPPPVRLAAREQHVDEVVRREDRHGQRLAQRDERSSSRKRPSSLIVSAGNQREIDSRAGRRARGGCRRRPEAGGGRRRAEQRVLRDQSARTWRTGVVTGKAMAELMPSSLPSWRKRRAPSSS